MNNTISNKETFQKLFGIDVQIKFIEMLLSKYNIPTERKSEFQKSLNAIKARAEDQNLYLAVIGEVNAGKSSFINALLRDMLLIPGSIPAITAAITELRYGPVLSIEAIFLNGKVLKYPGDKQGFESLFKSKEKTQSPELVIEHLTANEEVSKLLGKVVIYHPANILKEGLVIFDTPGSNASDRHTSIVQKTVKEQCDAGIILVPAHIPLSMTLVKFLGTTLDKTAMERCLFILTQIDRVKRVERSRLPDFIAQKIIQELKVASPRVQMTTVNYVLQQLDSSTNLHDQRLDPAEENELAESFFKMEMAMFRLLKEQRESIILERISLLLSSLFTEMHSVLGDLKQGYQKEHKALISNRIQDLEDYLEEMKQKIKEDFKDKAKSQSQTLQKEIEKTKDSCWNEISYKLNANTTNQGIKSFLDNTVLQIVTAKINGLDAHLANFNHSIEKHAGKLQMEFQESFHKSYTQLATLGGLLPKTTIKYKFDLNINNQISFKNTLSSVSQIVANAEEEEGEKTGAGMVVGVLIGGLLTGGVGWILGPIIGSFLGSLFGPSVDEIKSKVSVSLKSKIDAGFGELSKRVKENIKSTINKYVDKLEDMVEECFERYSSLAQQMDQRDKRMSLELELKEKEVSYEMKELENYQGMLKTRIEKLKTIK